MRLYERRFAKKSIDRRVSSKTESRDGILWSIDTTNYLASVKVQGSNELIWAHYPRNWKRIPYWLKPGNAVQIRHRQGIRGFVELVGEGRAIPTPVEGDMFPISSALGDTIISGCEVNETDPPQMALIVSSGTFRIGGVTYYLTPDVTGYIVMDDPAPMTMGSATLMGSGGYTVEIGSAPTVSGEFRYDLICVGTDLAVDYISGETSTTPEKPDLPDSHVMLGDYVLVKFARTAIINSDIGAIWTVNYPAWLTMDFTPVAPATFSPYDQFNWLASGEVGWPYPNCLVTVTVKDQYDVALSAGAGGFNMTLYKESGTGDVYSGDDGWDNNSVAQNFSSSYYNFRYRRDQSGTEYSPMFRAVLDYTTDKTKYEGLQLLASDSGEISFTV